MKKNSRSTLFVGLALLCALLAVYVKKENAKSRAVTEHKAGLIAEEKEKQRQAKLDDDWPRFRQLRLESYIIRQPVSEETKNRAAELGIKINPFFDSAKVVNVVIPQAKIPLINYDPEFARLLKESRASDAEVDEEKGKWWERNGERYVKEGEKRKEILRNQPEVAEADRRYKKRMEEIRAIKPISWSESSKLEFEAAVEYDGVIFEVRKKLSANPVTPAANSDKQQK